MDDVNPKSAAYSFKSVWSVLDQAKWKSIRIRDNINYLVDGTEQPQSDREKQEDPVPSINTLQTWADEIDHILTITEKLVTQLRGNS